MTIEEAIKTAIEYEIKVRDAYLKNLDVLTDPVGRRVFRVLGEEEQGHVDFLEACLAEWKASGQVSVKSLDSIVPSKEVIEASVNRLEKVNSERDYGSERKMLEKALEMEEETSAFYQRMVKELGEEGKLFQRFVEIEEGHVSIVQAEIDYLSSSGMFFDFQEFNMEH
jgi:rubrerythrin